MWGGGVVRFRQMTMWRGGGVLGSGGGAVRGIPQIRGFCSGYERAKSQVTWFKVLKLAATHRLFLLLKSRCEKRHKCALRLTRYMTWAEAKKTRLHNFGTSSTRKPLHYDPADPESLRLACLHFAETYCPTILALTLTLGGFAFNSVVTFFHNSKRDEQIAYLIGANTKHVANIATWTSNINDIKTELAKMYQEHQDKHDIILQEIHKIKKAK